MKAVRVGDCLKDSESELYCAGEKQEKAHSPQESVFEQGTTRVSLELECRDPVGDCIFSRDWVYGGAQLWNAW